MKAQQAHTPFFKRVCSKGGKVVSLLQEIDWARHPLGEPDSPCFPSHDGAGWPGPLKTVLGIVLNASQPMVLYWGEDFFQFANDAFVGLSLAPARALGQKADERLQQPAADFLAEARQVFRAGQGQTQPISAGAAATADGWQWSAQPVFRHDHARGAEGSPPVVGGVLVMLCAAQRPLQQRVEQGIDAAARGDDPLFPAAALPVSSPLVLPVTLTDTLAQPRSFLLPAYDGDHDCDPSLFRRGRCAQVVVVAEDQSVLKQTEAKLRQADAINALFLENSPVGLAMFDHEMRYLRVSARWLKEAGLKAQDVMGRNHYEVFPFLPERWRESHTRCLAGATEKNDCDAFVQPDGTIKYIQWEVRPWLAHGGGVGGLIIFSEDITARQVGEEKLRLIAELAPQHLWILDETGVATYHNTQLVDFLGLESGTSTGDSWPQHVHPDDRPKLNALWAEATAKHTPMEAECRIRSKDGEYRWFLNRAVLLKNKTTQLSQWIGVSVDISRIKQAEELLRESELRQKLLSETMLQGVVFHDHEGSLLSANPAALAILGRSCENNLATSLRRKRTHPNLREDGSHFSAQDHPTTLALHTGMAQKGVILSVYNPREEAYRLLELDAVPLLRGAEEQVPYGVVSIFSDITERKRIENELKQSSDILEAIMSASTDMIFVKSRTSHIIYANPAMQAVLGKGKENLYGKTDTEFLPGDQGEVILQTDERIMSTGVGEIITEALTVASGETRLYWSNKQVRRDFLGRVVGLIGISRDITEITLTQERLQHSETRLQQLVEHLQATNQRKNTFLANMSHEIRTPLAAIAGFTELLKDAQLLVAERERYVAIVESNCHQLVALVNDTLDLSKIEAGYIQIHNEDCDLQAIVEEVIALLTLKAGQKRLSLRLEWSESAQSALHSDAVRLKQILTNLISNAIKFTPDSGSVVVQVQSRACGEQAFDLEVRVRDSGIGISENDRSKLFQIFSQANSSIKQAFGGNGLGLFLSRQLAESLGGALVLEETAEGKGSIFLLTLFHQKRAKVANTEAESTPESLTSAFASSLDETLPA